MEKADYVTQQRFERFAGSLIDLDAIVEWIEQNMAPEQVFEKSALGQWAEENDYVVQTE